MVTKIDTGNTTGFTRILDEMNRFVIPREILNKQELKSREIKVFPFENGVYIEFDK